MNIKLKDKRGALSPQSKEILRILQGKGRMIVCKGNSNHLVLRGIKKQNEEGDNE